VKGSWYRNWPYTAPLCSCSSSQTFFPFYTRNLFSLKLKELSEPAQSTTRQAEFSSLTSFFRFVISTLFVKPIITIQYSFVGACVWSGSNVDKKVSTLPLYSFIRLWLPSSCPAISRLITHSSTYMSKKGWWLLSDVCIMRSLRPSICSIIEAFWGLKYSTFFFLDRRACPFCMTLFALRQRRDWLLYSIDIDESKSDSFR